MYKIVNVILRGNKIILDLLSLDEYLIENYLFAI